MGGLHGQPDGVYGWEWADTVWLRQRLSRRQISHTSHAETNVSLNSARGAHISSTKRIVTKLVDAFNVWFAVYVQAIAAYLLIPTVVGKVV